MTRPPDPAGQYPYQPQPQYAPQPPAKKKMGKGKVFLLGCLTPLGVILILVIIIGIASSGGSGKPAPTGVPAGNEASTPVQQPKPAAAHTVVYKVAGTAKTASSITYTTDGMTTTNQESDVALPWSKTITLPAGKPLQIVQVLAQGNGAGTIEVTITVDGTVVKQASATGYGVASANSNIGTMGG